jgi:hypothetical protein
MTTIFVALVLIGTAVLFIVQRKRLGQALVDNADKSIGAIASRLGLAVVEGDPGTNLLYFQQPAGDFERKIRLAGQPYGRATTFLIVDGQKTEELLVARRITRRYACILDVQTNVAFPAFEVSLRKPNEYLVPDLGFAERTDLHEVSTGDAQLDALFRVRAADPRLGRALVPSLILLTSHLYVHMAGEGNRVWSALTRMGLPYFSYAPEEILLSLETAACALEGRPAPARSVAAPPAHYAQQAVG